MIRDLTLAEQVRMAEHLATVFHSATNKTWGKRPYIKHPERVAAALVDAQGYDELSAVDKFVAAQDAWLHDTVEDTALTPALLRTLGFRPDVVDDVYTLTRFPDIERAVYIGNIMRAPKRVRVVKRADMKVNMDALPELWLVQRQRAERLRTQYEMEWEILHDTSTEAAPVPLHP